MCVAQNKFFSDPCFSLAAGGRTQHPRPAEHRGAGAASGGRRPPLAAEHTRLYLAQASHASHIRCGERYEENCRHLRVASAAEESRYGNKRGGDAHGSHR